MMLHKLEVSLGHFDLQSFLDLFGAPDVSFTIIIKCLYKSEKL